MLHAVIMAGGSGTRFWPASRRTLPKQFLNFGGVETLIQQAASRCLPAIPPERQWVVTGALHLAESLRQLPQITPHHILAEPCGRNTAPCIALAAKTLLQVDPDAVMLVMPADHIIQPIEAFQRAVQSAAEIVAQDPTSLVLFGVQPTYPATGFGYIERGDSRGEAAESYLVRGFKEKPSFEVATQYVENGGYYWNCGIFVWKARTILEAIQQFEPGLFDRLGRIKGSPGEPVWEASLKSEFPAMPSISIDYAVLERAQKVVVVPAPFQWDDVGSWEALPRLLGDDESGNTLSGSACVVESRNCVLKSEGNHLVAAVGVNDLVIIHTPTATLVARRHDEAGIRKLVQALEQQNHQEFL